MSKLRCAGLRPWPLTPCRDPIWDGSRRHPRQRGVVWARRCPADHRGAAALRVRQPSHTQRSGPAVGQQGRARGMRMQWLSVAYDIWKGTLCGEDAHHVVSVSAVRWAVADGLGMRRPSSPPLETIASRTLYCTCACLGGVGRLAVGVDCGRRFVCLREVFWTLHWTEVNETKLSYGGCCGPNWHVRWHDGMLSWARRVRTHGYRSWTGVTAAGPCWHADPGLCKAS